MSEQMRRKIEDGISSLRERLERWLRVPMLESVREIGAAAIRAEMKKVAEPLKR